MGYIGNQSAKIIYTNIDRFRGEVTDIAALNAITGMVQGDMYKLISTNHAYMYDGSVWVDMGDIEGPQGPKGIGISSIVRTAGDGSEGTTDTYTITYDDTSTSTFNVTNGTAGTINHIAKTDTVGTTDTYTAYADAAKTQPLGSFEVYNGIDGKAITTVTFTSTTDESGLPAQSGGTDTYTISYSDNTTSTYDIYNGMDVTNVSVIDDDSTTTTNAWSASKISSEFANVQASLNFDSTPTKDSMNPVTSDGVFDGLAAKQDTLVSGTTIKTINGSSVLGSGDLVVSGGSEGLSFNVYDSYSMVGSSTYDIQILSLTEINSSLRLIQYHHGFVVYNKDTKVLSNQLAVSMDAYHSIEVLSSTRVLFITHAGSGTSISVVLLGIDGSTLSVLSTSTITSPSNLNNNLITDIIDGDVFMMWKGTSASYGVIIQTTSDTLSNGTILTISTTYQTPRAIKGLDASRILISIADGSVLAYTILSKSGTTLSLNTIYTVTASTAYYPSPIIEMPSGKFLIASPTNLLITVSGVTATHVTGGSTSLSPSGLFNYYINGSDVYIETLSVYKKLIDNITSIDTEDYSSRVYKAFLDETGVVYGVSLDGSYNENGVRYLDSDSDTVTLNYLPSRGYSMASAVNSNKYKKQFIKSASGIIAPVGLGSNEKNSVFDTINKKVTGVSSPYLSQGSHSDGEYIYKLYPDSISGTDYTLKIVEVL